MTSSHSALHPIEHELNQRILILDGAMGTMIQNHQLSEVDFRGQRFKDWHCDVKGNNDLLVLTQPQIIKDIHLPISMLAPILLKLIPLTRPLLRWPITICNRLQQTLT